MSWQLALVLVLAIGAQTSLLAQDVGLTQTSPSAASQAEQEVLRARITTIELERETSLAQFRSDKKSCAATVLVNRCTSEALVRRRARDAVLRDGQISAKAQLRAVAAKTKNADLAAIRDKFDQESSDEAKREEIQAQRSKKLADAQERLEAHLQKKTQEAENRRLYEEKVKRSEEKQAEIRARFKASGTQPKAKAFMTIPQASSPGIENKPGPTTSAN